MVTPPSPAVGSEPCRCQPLVQSVPIADSEVPSSLTLAEAYQRYIDDPTRSWFPSTLEAYETCRKLAIAVIGGEVPIASICRAHCRELLDVLRFLPSNAGKKFPRLSPREASDLGRQEVGIKTISAANANSLMSNMSSFLNWAVNEELLGRNPARGLRLPDPVSKRDKRLPFSQQQLQTIFDAPLYSGCQDGKRGYAKPGSERPRNARFWVPLIGLFTGARLGEICQLDTTDVRQIDGIFCIVITQCSLNGSTDKHLKTAVSERVIPVHPKLVECGLLNFAAIKREAGERKLFNDIGTGSTGSRSVTFSKWFTQSCGRPALISRAPRFTLSVITSETSYARRALNMTSPCCSAGGPPARHAVLCPRITAAVIVRGH